MLWRRSSGRPRPGSPREFRPSRRAACRPQPLPPSSPNGRSSVWLSPAEYPSAEIVSSQVTMPMRLVILSPLRSDLRRLHGELSVNGSDVFTAETAVDLSDPLCQTPSVKPRASVVVDVPMVVGGPV